MKTLYITLRNRNNRLLAVEIVFALLGILLVVALIAAGVSAVSAQESDDESPTVSLRQSENATSTPITIDPPDSDDPESDDGATGQTPQPPAPPRNLTAAVLGQKAVSVDWEAPVNDGGGPITSYDLNYGPVGESPTIVSVSDLYNVVTGLRPETRYEFRVSARNSAGLSSYDRGLRHYRRTRRRQYRTTPRYLHINHWAFQLAESGAVRRIHYRGRDRDRNSNRNRHRQRGCRFQ